MKIRTVTYGISLAPEDFHNEGAELRSKIITGGKNVDHVVSKLIGQGYEIQTVRFSFNQVEHWLDITDWQAQLILLRTILDSVDKVQFVALGCCSTLPYIEKIPSFLALSRKFNSSVHLPMDTVVSSSGGVYTVPDYACCLAAAKVCLQLSTNGDGSGSGNFHFCIGFNCVPGTPFFPISFYHSDHIHRDGVSIGLENGYFLFLACHGVLEYTSGASAAELNAPSGGSSNATSTAEQGGAVTFDHSKALNKARDNLVSVIAQAVLPVQRIAEQACKECSIGEGPHNSASVVSYLGADISINPGLTAFDSVGAGIEWMLDSPERRLPPPVDATDSNGRSAYVGSRFGYFGSFGTLPVVSAITSALKQLVAGSLDGSNGLKLVGYNGLMLPVMEDIVLADRAAGGKVAAATIVANSGTAAASTAAASSPGQSSGLFTLRDLLVFSTVCGVGLDTVPVPGNVSAEELSAVYMEVGTLAFRLNKPLSCRLMPIPGKMAGEVTTISDNPHLCNTKVFAL